MRSLKTVARVAINVSFLYPEVEKNKVREIKDWFFVN